MPAKERKICSRCILDATISNITFDKNGVCNFCHIHDEMAKQYPKGKEAAKKLADIVRKIKKTGEGKKYDCVVGVSGGRDSTYLLYVAKKLGLRPLAVHFDNGWNSVIAVANIKKALEKYHIDLETWVVNWDEFKDIQKSFLKASTSDAEIPTDVGIHTALHYYAAKENIKYILNGHSFRTEGIMPMEWTYMDGRYIASVQKKFGQKKLKTFPNFYMKDLFYYTFFKKIKTIPLLNYVPYNQEEVGKILKKELGWVYYGGHHHENYYTHFFQSYYLPQKFGIDKRKIELSALIRSGQITRPKALLKIAKPYEYDQELVNYTVSKLGLTKSEMAQIMKEPRKTFHDYPTYYPFIKIMRFFVKKAADWNLIPKVLYQKFFS